MVGGALATVAMSAFMLGAKKLGALGEPPPRKLGRLVARLGGDLFPSRRKQNVLATVGHFGIGIGAGGIFGTLAPQIRRTLPLPIAGAVFGSLIWAAGYLGAMPALGLMAMPKHDRRGRPLAMIVAHWVYGTVLAASMQTDETTRMVPSAG
jgi:hypothetical protein